MRLDDGRSIKSGLIWLLRQVSGVVIATFAPCVSTSCPVREKRMKSGSRLRQNEAVTDQAAYQRILESGELDRCGVTLLAGKAVGAPFVGAVASTLVLSEVLRLLHGGTLHRLIDINLLAVEHRATVPNLQDFKRLNPGYTLSGSDLRSPVAGERP